MDHPTASSGHGGRSSSPPVATDIRSVLDAIGDAILMYDGASLALLDVNQAVCDLWGRRRHDILSMDIAALSCSEHPFTQADTMRLLERTRSLGAQSTTWLARHSDGHPFWAEMHTSAGRVGGRDYFFATVRDVSRRKAAEDQLRASESTFRSILDSVHEEICVQDADGRLLELNKAAERLFGLPREKLLGRSPAEFAAPGLNDFQLMHEAVGQTFAGHPQLFDFWCRREDGTLQPREVSVTPGFHFGKPAAIAVLRDISERKQIEAERERAARVLRESEERFRLILGRVPTVAVQGYTADGTIRYWNEASERIYGYTAGEALGRNLLDLVIPTRMRAEMREAIREMAETGQSIPAGEMDLMRKDGSSVSVFSSHAVVRTAQGTADFYCLDVDMTERKRAEQERLDLQQRLMRADKFESLAVLAGGVAHDFNNLLTAILGNLDLARLELPAGSPAHVSVNGACDAARAAAELARQMLAFSGRSRMMLIDLDLSRFVQDQLRELREDAPCGLEIAFQRADEPLKFVADCDQIRQTVRNLVLNAIEAVREVDQPRIDIATRFLECDAQMLELSRTEHKPSPGHFVALDVIDNGEGMDDESLQRMFEPFFTTRFAGRGLGLAVVMGVVRAHRGAILVRSRPAGGTSIRVLFPAVARDRTQEGSGASAPAGSAAQAPTPRSVTSPVEPKPHPLILLVDDDPFVRMVFTRMAPLIGLDLVAAETGEDAVRMFQPRAAEFSAVILDLTLPGMSGWECHDIMHALRPDVPIIISSGSASDASTSEFDGRGVAGVLPKPFTIEGLQQTLESIGVHSGSEPGSPLIPAT